MDKKTDYSVIIPVYNEEQSIYSTINVVIQVLNTQKKPYEIIVVDDGSRDKTPKILSSIRDVKVITHAINKGYGASILDGVKAAKSELIITTDADGTYPFEDIPKLLKEIDDYAMVSGSRTGKNVKIPILRRFGKVFHTLAISLAAGKYIPDMNSGLRVFRKDVFLKYRNIYPSGFSITTTSLLAMLANGHNVKFVPIDYKAREGKSKISLFSDGFNFILLILRALAYFNPLKIFLPMSLLFFLIGLADIVLMNMINGQLGISDSALLFIVTSIIILLFGLMADMMSKIMFHLNEKE